MTPFDKALAGLITPIVVFVLAHFGLAVDATLSAEISTVITGLVVYLVPNKVSPS